MAFDVPALTSARVCRRMQSCTVACGSISLIQYLGLIRRNFSGTTTNSSHSVELYSLMLNYLVME